MEPHESHKHNKFINCNPLHLNRNYPSPILHYQPFRILENHFNHHIYPTFNSKHLFCTKETATLSTKLKKILKHPSFQLLIASILGVVLTLSIVKGNPTDILLGCLYMIGAIWLYVAMCYIIDKLIDKWWNKT